MFLVNVADRTIRCFVDAGGAAWIDVFVRRILPRIAILFGAAAIHGAALATGDGGCLLLGHSGAGKSTLSAFLANAGWQLLSDDISLVWNEHRPELAPAAKGVSVWPDSREGLALPLDHCVPMPGYDGKVHFMPDEKQDDMPVPLKALIFLERSADCAEVKVTPISSVEGLLRASTQRIRLNPSDETGLETQRHFEQMSAIIRDTRCYRLVYPADYAALPAVAHRLDEILRG